MKAAGKHRAALYCRLSLRERMEERYFRGAKGALICRRILTQVSCHAWASLKAVRMKLDLSRERVAPNYYPGECGFETQ